jgi:hypothetical protein
MEHGGIILQRAVGRKGLQDVARSVGRLGGGRVDEIEQAVRDVESGGELACSAAFAIADRLDVDPLDVGQAADALAVRLVGCQLGLFGYGPKSEGAHRRVSAMTDVPPELKRAIEAALDSDGKLTCAKAWRIADDLEASRQTVSNAAEGLGVRIKDCQLGAF